jgi:diguanylate cyclase (GGDEF)-like protein
MKSYQPYIIFLLVLTGLLTLFFINRTSELISIDRPNTLSTWSYEGESVTLPTTLDVEKNTVYRIDHVLDTDFHEPKVLMIRSSLSNVKVYLDDALIYEKTYGTSLDEPYASTWHFITLPRHVDGQTLSLEFSSPYQAMSGQINEVFYGTEAMHYNYIIETYGLRLFIGLIVLLIGLIVMISHFVIRKKQDRGYAYAGLFAIILSLWMIAESRTLQFFSGSELLIGTLAYLALPLFAVPMVIYLKDYILVSYKKPMIVMNYIYLSHFAIINILYFTKTYDFFETVIFSQVWLAVGIITAITCLVLDYKQNQNEKAFKFIKAFIVLIIFAVFEFLNFLLGRFENTSLYISIGIVVVMVYILANYVRYLVERLKISYETEFYEKLAYMDHVTQGQNRLAFERDMDQIFKDPIKKKELRLILFDLDGLKKINDEHGHVVGDEAIKKAYEIARQAFADQGECYRIGGDEFACIFQNIDHEEYLTRKKLIEDLTKAFEEATPYHFGLSLGSSLVYHDDLTPLDLMHIADQEMYEYKKSKKQTS